MMQDEEFEALVTTPERIEALGFKPQKEFLTNHLLPYADKLDEESQKFLKEVKENFAKAVMLREKKPACAIWSARLMKYVRIYGLKFGKEDHIALIKLTYELILIPDLEPNKIQKYVTLLILLTKKRYLISPEELTLPWRPIYELGVKIFDKNSSTIGMYRFLTHKTPNQGLSMIDIIRKFMSGNTLDDTRDMCGLALQNDNEFPTSLEGTFTSMIKCIKPYFGIYATREILDEMFPEVCPWSTSTHILAAFTVFLPVGLPPEHASQSHELWFDQIMTMWDTCSNNQSNISDILVLFAHLAKKNPSQIDWTPHVPKMFMRFLHSLNLPVSYKDMQYSRSHSLDMKCVSMWIVWTINPDGVVLKHLRSFLGGMESYLQSANSGRWSYKLKDLLRKLAREFLTRVRREREQLFQSSWENKPPEHYKLRDEDITQFVEIVLEPTLLAVFGRTGTLDISIALQNLATLRPAIVIPPLIERLRTSLTSLTEPHRVTVAMSAVAAVARPMVRGAHVDYPEGPTHVIPLLMAVLPGLDANDLTKTVVTLHFILIFSGMVPLIDCSSAHEFWLDLTEEELQICEASAQFEDFILIFLDRIFAIIESSVMEQARLDTKDSDWIRSKADTIMEVAISTAATAALMQCSPNIFKKALKKFKSFATESTFETHVSGSMVGILMRAFARIDSELTLAAFVPKLLEEIHDLLANNEALRDENPPRDLVYRLVLLKHVLECDGKVLLKYVPQILPVLDRILKLHANYAILRACEVLGHMLHSLACVELREWRSTSKDFSSAPQAWLPIREWGRGCFLKETNFIWHTPNAEEAECAQMLVDRYLKPEVARLQQWLSGERPMCRYRRLRSFYIINAIMACSTFLPQADEEPIRMVESQVPATSMPLTNGVPYRVTLDGENMRTALTRLLLAVQTKLLANITDETRGLETLILVWERIILIKSPRAGPGLESRLRSYAALERAMDGRGGKVREGADKAGTARLRMLVADAVKLQDESRLDLVCEAGITPTALQALHALCDLAVNIYSSVRILSQIRLYWMFSHYPYSYKALIPRILELLAEGGEGEEWHAKHKGALFIMLGPKTGPLFAKQDWEVVRALWPAVLRAPLSEKPSLQRLEQAFSECLHRNFPAVNTRLTVSDRAIAAAERLLDEAQLNDPEFKSMLEKAVEKEHATCDRAEKIYFELLDDLANVIETPNMHWRRVELAMQMLSYCALRQTPYSPRVVRAVVRGLLHENIAVRRAAHRLTHFALKQRKHPLKKIDVDPYQVAGVHRPARHVPGYRKDLEWAIWSEDQEIKSDEEWDKPWLRQYSYGFNAWPKTIKVAAPISEQKYSLDTPPEEMEEGERYLFEFFSNEANIKQLVAYLTVEDKKGKDKFNGTRFAMFRMAFAHFGERVSDRLMRHALRCARTQLETPQRFAAELAAAALRAPRYWPRTRALALQQSAMDVIKAGLTAVIPETGEDWGTCVATGVEKMDPRRGSAVLRQLLELCTPPPALGDADPDQHTSFVVCSRLYALQGALGSLTWRTAPLAAELLKRLDAANFIQHPYQNVREIVGSMLMTIFDTELVFPGGSRGGAPCLKDFLTSIKPRLAALYDENGDIVIKTAASILGPCSSQESCVAPIAPVAPVADIPITALADNSPRLVRLSPESPRSGHTHQSKSSTEAAEAEGEESCIGARLDESLDNALRLAGDEAPAQRHHARAVNLLTTVLRGCMGVIVRSVNSNTETQYMLLSTACALAARGRPQPHEELPRAAGGFLASLALANHFSAPFDRALEELELLAEGRSWWARLAALEFAQPLLFYGLPLLCAEPNRAVRAESFALKLMRDARVEVRQAAAKLLMGLMHCRALPNEEKTLRSLTTSCRSKELVERHCGVLGLCAYLTSRPYSLGPKIGKVLAELSRHTCAPDPIPATIRTALADFRRTHQDEWPKHREQLTEEELDLLADLTSPPSYCA